MEITRDLEEFDPFRATNRGITIFLILSIFIAVAQIFSVVAFWRQSISIPVFFLIHIFSAAVVATVALAYYWLRWDLRFPLMTLVVILVLGPFGSLLIVIALILFIIQTGHGIEFGTWLDSLFPNFPARVELDVYERIISDWDDFSDKINLIPYTDIMSFGSLDAKMAALVKMATNFKPQFAPILMQGLQDPNISVRVQAAAIISRFETNYSNNYARLQKSLDKRPNSSYILLEFATLCDHSSHLGIFDKERSSHMQARAIELYEAYRKIAGKDCKVNFSLGWLYICHGNPRKGRALIENCLDAGIAPDHVIRQFLTSLLLTKEYADLRRYCAHFYDKVDKEKAAENGLLQELELWKNGVKLG